MKKSNFALRLQPSLMEEAKKLAKAEGVAVNQLINVAVAEKVSALHPDAQRQSRCRTRGARQVDRTAESRSGPAHARGRLLCRG